MKLSIIIPVYNVENYIEDCLDSVYDGNLENFEVLCIDDRGDDKSIHLIKEYIRKKNIKNLTIIEHEENKGLSEARNTGINLAIGQYICFLDSDDMLNSKNLCKLLDEAIKNNLDIIEGRMKEVSETSINITTGMEELTRDSTEILDGDNYFSYMCKKSEYFPMACCRIYKLEYLKGKYKFEPNLKFEDEEFSPRVIIDSQRIKYLDLFFYIYRRRDNSITTNIVKDNKWVYSYFKIIDKLTQYAETIKDKKSYSFLKERIANFTLSLLKNPIEYGSSKENLGEIIEIVKCKKIYKIPANSKNILIKVQGYIMKYPKVFINLYKMKGR